MGIKVSAVSTEAREGMPRRVPDMAGWRGQDWGHQGLRVSGVPTVLCPVLLLLLPESGAGVCVCGGCSMHVLGLGGGSSVQTKGLSTHPGLWFINKGQWIIYKTSH